MFRTRDGTKNATTGSAHSFFMGSSVAGKSVNERSDLQMTAVYACAHPVGFHHRASAAYVPVQGRWQQEMQIALDATFKNEDPKVQKEWEKIPLRVERPTPEDVIPAIVRMLGTS